MATICPTVLADNTHTFREQLERIETFAERLQIDLMDGIFAPSKSVELDKVWLPEHIPTDLHLMFQKPYDSINQLIALKPNMVIIHAESDCDIEKFANTLGKHNIKCGIAILPATTTSLVNDLLPYVEHVLIFGGKLGYFGGMADLTQLSKVSEIKASYPDMEIGWDGGVNDENVQQIAQAGIDIINVGGFIQKADDPKVAWQLLRASI